MYTQIGTPVYMSPQLISSRQTKAGYDATKADVWACGVLLFVMLLGMFPFEHTEHPDPNSSEAHVEVRAPAAGAGAALLPPMVFCHWQEQSDALVLCG